MDEAIRPWAGIQNSGWGTRQLGCSTVLAKKTKQLSLSLFLSLSLSLSLAKLGYIYISVSMAAHNNYKLLLHCWIAVS